MSDPKTNFENNNARMSELTKNINEIFGYILLYTIIILTTLSALFGGLVVYPIYGVIYMFNRIREHCCKIASQETTSAAEAETTSVAEAETTIAVKKPLIDETWCNVSIKNIINFESEVANEVADANEVVDANDVADINEVADVNEVADANEVAVEEILSIRRPSEEELKQFQEEEDASSEEDNSPRDKYSIGHYKSKTYKNDPLDFNN